MAPRKNGHAICSGCQQPAPGYDRLAERRFEFVPLWGIRVFLLYKMRRVECKTCGVKVEQVPWAEGKKEHILDRFHIVAMLNKAIDEVRATEHKQLQADGYEPVLKKTRWCRLKRKENLTEKEEIKLNTVLQYNLKSVRAYLLREEFQVFWDYISPHWAGKYLDRWCTRVMRSKIEPMKTVAKSVRRHKPLILNWFKAKKAYSSGIVEGLNTRIKLTTRKSYGFRTYRCAEIALYHTLGKLPEPEMTHRFY
ncbi:transposase [Endozoicomonas sp. ALB091]|uniref:transposase n=1 Tax=Endozoicomonas sp. ALB091 TaxID=3403073 RepID=UPI003BB7717F